MAVILAIGSVLMNLLFSAALVWLLVKSAGGREVAEEVELEDPPPDAVGGGTEQDQADPGTSPVCSRLGFKPETP